MAKTDREHCTPVLKCEHHKVLSYHKEYAKMSSVFFSNIGTVGLHKNME